MAGKHRKSSRSKRAAVVGVATVTATALTVGAAPPPPKPKPVVNKDVNLAAAVSPFPGPDQIPDLTFGGGTAVYNIGQAAADVLIRAIVENVNLAALAQAAGLDPQSVLENLLGGVLGQIPTNLLDDVIGALPIDISAVVTAILDPLNLPLPLAEVVGDLLNGALADAGLNTVNGLLGLLGLNLSDVLNLSDLNVPGVNIITAGPPFTLLKLLGVDLGWVPGLPNSVANEVNNTPYLKVGLSSLLEDLDILGAVGDLLGGIIPDLDVVDVRVPVVIGFGLGAFAAGAAYDKVIADLPNQPGGTAATEHPLLGSITVLPMVLLRNPGRANGGLFARFYPLAGLFGIDTVTPETEVTHSGGIPILNTGLSLGGANVIPVKIDGTIMYDPLSDFAAWPNPFTLANNAMAGLLPTYILRGLTLDTIPDQLTTQIEAALANLGSGNPLALNLYLTLPSATLPVLEPLYLLSDVTSLITLGALSTNPFGMLANAFAPALASLVNLGYTDVVRNPDGTYTRTLTDAGTPTPFLSFPTGINPLQVPGDIINSLVKGIQKEFLSGNPTPATPNAITSLLKLLTGSLGLDDILGGILNGLNLTQLVTEQVSPLAADALPSADAKMVTLSADPEGDVSTGKHAAPADAPVPDDTGAEPKHAADEADGAQDVEAEPDETTTTDEMDAEETDKTDEDTSSGSTTPKPTGTSTSPKPTAPHNPVGEVVGGATHAVAGAIGEVAHGVTTGVAGVLKGLTPKKPASATTKTTTNPSTSTDTKADTDKDSTGSGAGGSSSTSTKNAA
jgi:hypothetical protein